MQSGLLPDAAVGGGVGPGCFTHLKGIATTRGQLWWWETIMTFLLVSVRIMSCWPIAVQMRAMTGRCALLATMDLSRDVCRHSALPACRCHASDTCLCC